MAGVRLAAAEEEVLSSIDPEVRDPALFNQLSPTRLLPAPAPAATTSAAPAAAEDGENTAAVANVRKTAGEAPAVAPVAAVPVKPMAVPPSPAPDPASALPSVLSPSSGAALPQLLPARLQAQKVAAVLSSLPRLAIVHSLSAVTASASPAPNVGAAAAAAALSLGSGTGVVAVAPPPSTPVKALR